MMLLLLFRGSYFGYVQAAVDVLPDPSVARMTPCPLPTKNFRMPSLPTLFCSRMPACPTSSILICSPLAITKLPRRIVGAPHASVAVARNERPVGLSSVQATVG